MFPTVLLALIPAAGAGPETVSIAPTPDGKLLFVAQTDDPAAKGTGRVCVWDLTKPELTAVVGGLPGDLRVVRPTADGKRFVLLAGNEWYATAAEVWDVADGKRVRALDVPGPREAATAAVSPDGARVAVRPLRDEKAPVRVWDTGTGKAAEEVEKAAAGVPGALAFTPDGKRLVVVSAGAYAAFDLATGKKEADGKPDPAGAGGAYFEGRFGGGTLAALPGGKGVVSVAATGKRRQSYAIHLVAEKKAWFLGEFWDRASAPVVSPDGRLLVVSGGRDAGVRTVVLRLDADGAPELRDRSEKDGPPHVGWNEKQVPAWREWAAGEGTRAGVEPPGAVAFSADGKRVFTGTRYGVRVWDAGKLAPLATLYAYNAPEKGPPPWLVTTPAGAFVGSPDEEKALAKDGKDRDPAKVREALAGK